jgi:hypothetical protein
LGSNWCYYYCSGYHATYPERLRKEKGYYDS